MYRYVFVVILAELKKLSLAEMKLKTTVEKDKECEVYFEEDSAKG